MTAFHPVDDRLVVGLRLEGVAEYAVFHPPAQRLDHFGGSREIHVRNPQGEQVPHPGESFVEVPLEGGGAPSVHGSIEVVL